MTSLNPPPTIPPAVSKQLAILVGDSDANGGSKRVPQESAEAISEALRLFVKEAHRRASIEAECDDEGELDEPDSPNHETSNQTNDKTPIKAHHVTRIAGDLLMDFS